MRFFHARAQPIHTRMLEFAYTLTNIYSNNHSAVFFVFCEAISMYITHDKPMHAVNATKHIHASIFAAVLFTYEITKYYPWATARTCMRKYFGFLFFSYSRSFYLIL